MAQEEVVVKKGRKPPKARNPEARALESPLFRQRIVPNAKAYRRKRRNAQSGNSPLADGVD